MVSSIPIQVAPNRLHFKRSLFFLYPGIRVAVSSFLFLSIFKNFLSDFESFWHLLTNEKMQLSLQDIIVGVVTTKCPSHHLLNYMPLIGKVYLWVCRANKTPPKIHGLKKKWLWQNMKLNDLLSLTVKQLASLQENGLYLLRILFEIGNFFSSSSDCLFQLINCDSYLS